MYNARVIAGRSVSRTLRPRFFPSPIRERAHMRVCFVSHSAERGGAERSLLDTIRALSSRGVACSVLVPAPGPLVSDLEREGVRALCVAYRWWVAGEGSPAWRRAARIVWNLAAALPAARAIARDGADVVVTNTITVGTGALAARLARRPHVWHLREYGREHHRLTFDIGERLAAHVISRWSAVCFANSEGVAAKYGRGARAGKFVVVPQWVPGPPPGFDATPPEGARLRLVSVGWLGANKRQDEALQALARLVAAGIDAEIELVGGGDAAARREIEALVRRLDLGARVSLAGQVEDVWPHLARGHVAVVCSRWEAFGRATVEAMLAARPVVGARSGGTAELIRDGETGFLYEPGDVGALASILARLAGSSATRRKVGVAARAWAAGRFTEERYAEAVLDGLARAAR